MFLPSEYRRHENSAHKTQVDYDEAMKGSEGRLNAESLVYQSV